MQKLKTNEARPKFTGSYKRKRVTCFLYQPYRRRMRQLSRSRAVLCSEEMQKRDSKNLPLSYYIFGAVNNSQLDAKSIGKSLVGAKPIWQRKKPSVVKGWTVSTIVISQILHRLLEALFINLEATAPSEAWGGDSNALQSSSHPPVGQRNSKKSSAPYVQKCLFIYLFIYFNIYLFIYLFISIFIYLFIYLFTNSSVAGITNNRTNCPL